MTDDHSYDYITWVFEGNPDPEIVWPGAYRDFLRLYGWHVAAGALAAGWMTGGLDCPWKAHEMLDCPWKAREMTDSWQAGALSDGGTP